MDKGPALENAKWGWETDNQRGWKSDYEVGEQEYAKLEEKQGPEQEEPC